MQSWEMMYKVVVRAVLLYGSESWVRTDAIMKLLEEFNHIIVRRITGKTAWCVGEEGWEPPLPPDRVGHRGGGSVDNKGVCKEAAGHHCGLHCSTSDI